MISTVRQPVVLAITLAMYPRRRVLRRIHRRPVRRQGLTIPVTAIATATFASVPALATVATAPVHRPAMVRIPTFAPIAVAPRAVADAMVRARVTGFSTKL